MAIKCKQNNVIDITNGGHWHYNEHKKWAKNSYKALEIAYRKLEYERGEKVCIKKLG